MAGYGDGLYDVADRDRTIRKIARALRPGGTLSFRDHHIGAEAAAALLTADGYFELSRTHRATISLVRTGRPAR